MRRPLLFASLAALVLASPALARDTFLADGGGIRTERVVATPYGPAVAEVPALGEGRPFLQDGGGIRFAPELPRYDAGRTDAPYGGWRRSSSSVIEVPDGSVRSSASGAISVAIVNSPISAGGATRYEPAAYGGPKIIHVASARLDRRPFDASGLDIVRSGATKIIRIAPGRGDATEASNASARDETLDLEDGANLAALPAPRPADRDQRRTAPSQNGTESENGTGAVAAQGRTVPSQPPAAAVEGEFEPWTEAWRADCVERYPDFDASLGTYRDETGRRRFCTGAR